MSLSEKLSDSSKRNAIIDDCCTMIDEEVAAKGGLSGFAVKAGYAAVKGVKPGMIRQAVDNLLDEFAAALDPIWSEGVAKGNPTAHLKSNGSRVSNALLTVTDKKATKAKSAVIKGAYEKLRGSAQKHIEEALPRLAKMLEKHAG